MEQFQINSPEDIGRLIDSKMSNLREMTQRMIDTEMGIMELDLSLGCVGKGHIKKAHLDTESFKKETFEEAKKLAQKNDSDTLQEYKKLVDFI